MSLIGVVCQNSKQCAICSKIQNKLNKSKQNIIPISKRDIENIKNVGFETILVTQNKNNEKQEQLKQIISKAKNVIIDVDYPNNLELLKDINTNVISYGFSSKATITASSVEEEKILICIQRDFHNIKDKTINLQEFNMELKEFPKECNIHDVMGIVTLELFYK